MTADETTPALTSCTRRRSWAFLLAMDMSSREYQYGRIEVLRYRIDQLD